MFSTALTSMGFWAVENTLYIKTFRLSILLFGEVGGYVGKLALCEFAKQQDSHFIKSKMQVLPPVYH